MLNSTKQSDNVSEGKYAYGVGGGGSYNMQNLSTTININHNNNPNASNIYTGASHYGIGGMIGSGCPGSSQHQNLDKSYSIIIQEPHLSRSTQPLVIVDPPLEPYVKSYLLWSLFNVFCCCLIGGIVTTFMSFNVMRLNDDKEYKLAFRESGKVLRYNMIVSAIGALLILIVFPYVYVVIYPSLPKINW
jgi:hypothetical protein